MAETTNLSLDITSYKRIVAHKKSANFRDTQIETVEFPRQIPSSHVVVKVVYAGINASDINYTAGRYDPTAKPPLYPGFEALGTVIAKGSKVQRLNEGDSVFVSGNGCFSEYLVLSDKLVAKVPYMMTELLPIFGSGLTASIGLDVVGEMKSNETVLVTAAAGGTGLFAVQLAKLAGNHVIGTCSSEEKVAFLKKLGCDRVINYKKENLFKVLKSEYPKGVDIVYESVGGETFETCVSNLAVKGRLVVVGMVSGYQDQQAWKGGDKSQGTPLPSKLLAKSASVRGFFVVHYKDQFKKHSDKLVRLVTEGKLISQVDSKQFVGLEQVADAIDWMYQGKNLGKVIVNVAPSAPAASKL